jgi:hypothetical protein
MNQENSFIYIEDSIINNTSDINNASLNETIITNQQPKLSLQFDKIKQSAVNLQIKNSTPKKPEFDILKLITPLAKRKSDKTIEPAAKIQNNMTNANNIGIKDNIETMTTDKEQEKLEPILCFRNECIDSINDDELIIDTFLKKLGVKILDARKSSAGNVILTVENKEDISTLMNANIFNNCKKLDLNTTDKRPYIMISNADTFIFNKKPQEKLGNLGIIELIKIKKNSEDGNATITPNKIEMHMSEKPPKPKKEVLKAICKDVETQIKLIKMGKIKIGMSLYFLEPAIGKIRYCQTCKQIGHTNCKSDIVCERCSETDKHKNCSRPAKCANCFQDHIAFSRRCPKYKEQKEIQIEKAINEINRKNGVTSTEDELYIDLETISNSSSRTNSNRSRSNNYSDTKLDELKEFIKGSAEDTNTLVKNTSKELNGEITKLDNKVTNLDEKITKIDEKITRECTKAIATAAEYTDTQIEKSNNIQEKKIVGFIKDLWCNANNQTDKENSNLYISQLAQQHKLSQI